MPRRLPLFPISSVLFPGTRLPLHIFEPRYQQLLIDILGSDSCFGMLPAGTDGEQADPGCIGTIAQVISHQPLPDGRSNIVVEGGERFILRAWLDEGTPYHCGTVDALPDRAEQGPIAGDTLETLRRLAERCGRAMSALTDAASPAPWADDAATLSFQVASALPWGEEESRRLLALRTAAERIDLLLNVLPRIVPDLESRAAVHRQASSNGKGKHPPDLAT